MNLLEKTRNSIAKLLGIPSQQQISGLISRNMELQSSYDSTVTELRGVREDFRQLREDMKSLYSGLESDIRNVKMNIKQIKPILKVEDPEAVAFIKGILSRHDNNMQNNQTDLQQRILEFRDLKKQVESATSKASDASARLNNVLNELGIMPEYDSNTLISTFRDLILKHKLDDKAFGNVSE